MHLTAIIVPDWVIWSLQAYCAAQVGLSILSIYVRRRTAREAQIKETFE